MKFFGSVILLLSQSDTDKTGVQNKKSTSNPVRLKMVFILQTHPARGIQKNILKASNIAQKWLQCRFCAKTFPNKHSWESLRANTFDSCFNGRPVFKRLTYLKFKGREFIRMMTSLLADLNIFPFELSKLYSLQPQQPILDLVQD